MRADRLVALLMLLQTRGQVTAAEVAEELEVSERTARRDLEALGVAGLPIYSQQGRNGGWRLLGGGRTDLSGLTAAEARALFLVAGPASATPEVRGALRKLVRALPEPFRPSAQAASEAMVVDPSAWGGRSVEPSVPQHLDALQRAVVDGEQLRLGYVARDRAETERTVHPLGLAAKGSVWYLVGDTDTGLRTFRVDRVLSVVGLGVPVARPPGFDLVGAWKTIAESVELIRAPVRARLAVDPRLVARCRWLFGTRLVIGPAGPDGRVGMELRGQVLESLATELAGLVPDVEVLEPLELRDRLAAIGRNLVAVYEAAPEPPTIS